MTDENIKNDQEETEEEETETTEETVVEEKPSEVEKRIKELSRKVKLSSEEKDELHEKLQVAEKDKEFLSAYADVLGDYPQAKEYKDAIKEKVDKGYSVADATVVVLNEHGQFGTQERPIAENVAGGSASTTVSDDGDKAVSDMTQEERRAQLVELEKKGVLSLE